MSARPVAPPLTNWLESTISAIWPGSKAARVAELRGDLSTRRFWRVWIEGKRRSVPATAIAVDLGPDDLPLYARTLGLYPSPLAEPPYLNVHRFLKSIGAPVPEIYHAAAGERLLLVEDVGERALAAAAAANPAQAADLFRLAVDELLRLHVEGTTRRDPRCFAFGVAYDARLLRWELKEFVELSLEALGADSAAVVPELDALAARLDRIPRVFSHRDYHGQNLFLQDDRAGGLKMRILDFQDALMAPAAQDLAVLLTTRDTGRVISPAIENRLLDYYLAGLARRKIVAPGRAEFLEGYRLCVLQHALKMIGRFERFEREGKRGYAAYIPHAREQARRMLAANGDFPNLRRVFGVAA